MEHTAYIAVGSNKGDRGSFIAWALVFLMIEPSINVLRRSAVIETKPLGGPKQRDYFNAIWKIKTSLNAIDLMAYLLHVESMLGRTRGVKNGPRTIDLDILFYDTEVIIEDDVIIPHRRLHRREFLLSLLCELSPGLCHPVFGKSVKLLLREVRNEHSKVKTKTKSSY